MVTERCHSFEDAIDRVRKLENESDTRFVNTKKRKAGT